MNRKIFRTPARKNIGGDGKGYLDEPLGTGTRTLPHQRPSSRGGARLPSKGWGLRVVNLRAFALLNRRKKCGTGARLLGTMRSLATQPATDCHANATHSPYSGQTFGEYSLEEASDDVTTELPLCLPCLLRSRPWVKKHRDKRGLARVARPFGFQFLCEDVERTGVMARFQHPTSHI